MRALRKVLVVDDDPVVGKSMDRVLAEKGCPVITAVNGREALARPGRKNCDVVFAGISVRTPVKPPDGEYSN